MMDSRFTGTGFSAKSSFNALQNLGGLFRRDGANDHVDTVLRLDSFGSSSPHFHVSKGIKRKRACIDGMPFGAGHHSSISSKSKCSSASACTAISFAKEIEEGSLVDLDLEFTLNLGSSKKVAASNSEPPSPVMEVGLELSLSTGPSESDITSVHQVSPVIQIDIEESLSLDHESPLSLGLSGSTTATPKSSVTCNSGIIQTQRGSSSKLCIFTGCSKGARGSTGLCIAHGGGRRCQRSGCDKGAEGKTALCKAHGGGRRCQFLGCTKSAEGRTEFCIAHGGGRRCGHDGCTKAARGKSGLCIRHGGGKRCQSVNCTRSAEGLSGLCISHGGGRRCQYPECAKGAQGGTMFCKAHGGGKRCTVEGCTKGAEGSTPFCKGHGGGKRCSFAGCPKSVHGGTSFCVAHGGGKRCSMLECTKSARGRTEFCVRHGGGKRCKFEGCSKSAQGRTDFCKAHGGGKRCSRGQPGAAEYGNMADGPCGSFPRGKTGLCSMHGALVQDKRIHGGITLGPLLQDPDSTEHIQTVFEGDMNIDYGRSHSDEASGLDMNQNHLPSARKGPSSSPVPEGRVHGGSLLAMLRGRI